jgi:DNA-directed RNA polymerase subunit RPC12/RpoP
VTKKKAKQLPVVKSSRVKCPDCGATYTAGAPHILFCPVRTCDRCGTSFSAVIEPNKDGERICPTCELDDSD